MWHGLFSDASFYGFLHQCDADIAGAARAGGCGECRGRVDTANYERRPRGGPSELGAEYDRRLSFCCVRNNFLRSVVAAFSLLSSCDRDRRQDQLRRAHIKMNVEVEAA